MRTALTKLLLTTVVAAVLAAVVAAPASAQSNPEQGPGGPILVVGNGGFARYYAEILRGEGLNEFTVADTGSLNAGTLAGYTSVVLGESALDGGQVAALSGWVAAGGNLVAMRPDPQLAGLLGLSPAGGTLSDRYIGVNTSAPPGTGITGSTMQFHGAADNYALNGATEVARLYSSATAATSNPAVTLRSVGGAGGQAAAFTYDLAQSVVETRQGNRDWAGQERDGEQPPIIRSDDMFFPDFVDLNKVQIPSADEQQRLLANLLTHMNTDRMPLPRFWYLPRGEKAAVVMTGDDHASADGTARHFNAFRDASDANCSVVDWQCIRGTSYIYDSTPISNATANAYEAEGFEIALAPQHGLLELHRRIDPSGLDQPARRVHLPLPEPRPADHQSHALHRLERLGQRGHGRSSRTACASTRTTTTGPAGWVQNRPGMFTGSGMPQRFATTGGALIDVYQATTQLTDESEISYGTHISTLIGNAQGPQGFYGVFTANIHTDRTEGPALEIIEVAKANNVPVVTAKQMLDWVDGRNNSSFGGVGFQGNRLTFNLQRAAGANGLEAMVPMAGPTGGLNGLSRGGAAVNYEVRNVKGVAYAVFNAEAGAYLATYGTEPPATPPPAGGGGTGGGSTGGGSTGGGSTGGGSTGGGSGSTGGGRLDDDPGRRPHRASRRDQPDTDPRRAARAGFAQAQVPARREPLQGHAVAPGRASHSRSQDRDDPRRQVVAASASGSTARRAASSRAPGRCV